MKLWIAPIVALLVLSGCKTTKHAAQLQNINARQALVIEQQQVRIEALTQQLTKRKSSKRRNVSSSYALPTPPKKDIKLKKVEDANFNSEYMYPQTRNKPKEIKTVKTLKTTTDSSASMTKESCITMIGQDKFNKYTKMFGNEAASIKRCAMLKAIKH
jgi:hypothetical protein